MSYTEEINWFVGLIDNLPGHTYKIKYGIPNKENVNIGVSSLPKSTFHYQVGYLATLCGYKGEFPKFFNPIEINRGREDFYLKISKLTPLIKY